MPPHIDSYFAATAIGAVASPRLQGEATCDVCARLPQPSFPGGTLLRWPGLAAGMLYYSLRDKL